MDQSKQVAGAIAEELNKQNNQILSITDTMNELEDNLTKADKVIFENFKSLVTYI